MIKEIVKKKMGIKPESSSLSENAEGNEDAPESKQVIAEAGKTSCVHYDCIRQCC